MPMSSTSKGRLIAHPDISLVLRDTDLSPSAAGRRPRCGSRPATAASRRVRRPEQRRARGADRTFRDHAARLAGVCRSAAARGLCAALRRGIAQRVVLLSLGLAGATLVALLLARRMTGPIRELQEGAAQIGAGELDRRIDIQTGDELEGSGAAVQPHGRRSADLLRRTRTQGRGPHRRTVGSAGTADRDRRGAAGHQCLARRPRAGVRRDAGKGAAAVRRRFGILSTYDGETFRAAARGVPAALRRICADRLRPRTGFAGGAMLGGERVRPCRRMLATAYHSGDPAPRATGRLGGVRTLLIVPLLQGRRAARRSSRSTARRSGRSPTSRSRCCRTSRRRR